MKKIIALIVLIVLANCDIKPRTVNASSDKSSSSGKIKIAETMACDLYKIQDDGRVLYWSVCQGNSSTSIIRGN